MEFLTPMDRGDNADYGPFRMARATDQAVFRDIR